jgi:putative ABC transport system permease protein
MQTLLQDLRYGLRMLLKKPGFTLIAVITLALGIGGNSAIFSLLNAVLLRPLPYPGSERIMQIGPEWPGTFTGVSEVKFIFWREHNQSFEAIAATQGIGSGVNLAGGDEPEYVPGLRVSVDFFRALGAGPAFGRSFTKEEDSPAGERVVILSDGLWRRRFGSDKGLIGRSVLLNGKNYTVVGVMPPGFQYTSPVDVFVPMRTNPTSRDAGHNYTVIGRLKPGVTQAQALADMQLVFAKFKAAYPKMLWPGETGIRVRPLLESQTAGVRSLLLILLGAVGFVLLIACANVANLQLARAAARQKEMAIRLALGAGWGRIVRQLLTEGVLLALVGGAAGLLLAVWGVGVLVALIPEGMIPRAAESGLDGRVLAFTLTTAVVSGLLFALAPSIQAARVDVNHSLKEGGDKGAAGAGRGRLRSVLVVAEIALSLVLLAGAALLIRTFANLRQVDPGFDPRNVLTFQIAPNGPKYETTAENAEFFRRALERIKSLPGVEAVAVTSNLPLGQYLNLSVEVEGRPDTLASVECRMITPEYFRVMRMKLRQGREFTESDNASAEGVVIVNEAYARRFLANADPLGWHLGVAGVKPLRIIGVVNDVKQFGLNSLAPSTVYVPIDQIPDKLLLLARRFVTMKFAIRTAGNPLSLSAAVKSDMLRLDPTLPVTSLRSMEQIVAHALAPDRLNMTLLGVFAAVGLILAAVGIYGVMLYTVAQRTHEIGIRMALGARPSDVLKLVVGEGSKLALMGVALGLAGALALTRFLSSLLYGVRPMDPVTFVAVSVLLTGVALLASYIPARRATKVDPMIALRYE